MYFPTQIDIIKGLGLSKDDEKIIEELWEYKTELERNKSWWGRIVLRSKIKELEPLAYSIGFEKAIKKLSN